MHARSLLAVAAMLACRGGEAAARDLTVVVRPPDQEAIEKVFIQPFTAATGIAVQVGPGKAAWMRYAPWSRHPITPGISCRWTSTNWLSDAPTICSKSSTGRRLAARITICRKR